MRSSGFLSAAILVVLFTLSACGQKTFTEMAGSMTPTGVDIIRQESLPDSAKVIVLDAREWIEYNVSHIQGARHVGYEAFQVSSLSDIGKDEPIVVYCSVGYRSGQICQRLKEAGYTRVKNLWGGIFDWINHGRPVFNSSGKTDHIHPYNTTWAKWVEKGTITYE